MCTKSNLRDDSRWSPRAEVAKDERDGVEDGSDNVDVDDEQNAEYQTLGSPFFASFPAEQLPVNTPSLVSQVDGPSFE